MDWQVFWILLLIVTNGFFVAAQFALVNTRLSKLEISAKAGSKTALLARNIIKKADQYLITSQIGIGLSSLGLGWIAYSYLVANQGFVIALSPVGNGQFQIAYLICFLIIAFLLILVGALVPKFIAIHKPVGVLQAIAYPLRGFYWLLFPFVWFFGILTRTILRVVGMKDHLKVHPHTFEEIQLMIEQGKESGAVDSKEYELILKVFDFSERMVKSIMIPRNKISAIEANCSFDELIENVTLESYSRIPIYEEDIDQIVGIIHTKDIFPIIHKKKAFDLTTISRKPFFVPETKKINDLMTEMQQRRIQVAIVLDEFGGTAGLVTLEDIMEELVGEIQDEYDEETPIVEKISATEYMVDAAANVHDVNLFLPVELPESSEYDTISGLVGDLFDKIPDVGEHKRINGYNLIILKKSQQNVAFVKLEWLGEEEED